jgi:hypothetical protein
MDIMRSFGIPVPRGGMATNLDEVSQVFYRGLVNFLLKKYILPVVRYTKPLSAKEKTV